MHLLMVPARERMLDETDHWFDSILLSQRLQCNASSPPHFALRKATGFIYSDNSVSSLTLNSLYFSVTLRPEHYI